MIDITHKSNTFREAVASAIVKVGSEDTIRAIKENTVPKGNVFEMTKAATLLGIKKTADILPDCHPMPIEKASVNFEIKGLEIHIEVLVATIYKTGVEVEAMHGASVAALNIYDMLKPLDKEIEIKSIRLLRKKGGKSDFADAFRGTLTAAVVVCSDTISAGQKEDKAGIEISDRLRNLKMKVEKYEVIPDEAKLIAEKAIQYSDDGINLIIFTGGTGLSVRDVTPESLAPLLDRRIPGIEEAMRRHGQDRMPYSMLSRCIAGVRKKSLIMALPGSSRGAAESMDAIFPHVLHIFKIMGGGSH